MTKTHAQSAVKKIILNVEPFSFISYTILITKKHFSGIHYWMSFFACKSLGQGILLWCSWYFVYKRQLLLWIRMSNFENNALTIWKMRQSLSWLTNKYQFNISRSYYYCFTFQARIWMAICRNCFIIRRYRFIIVSGKEIRH